MSQSIDDLLDIMAALRDPATGCPWDVQQDFSTIAPYTIEEAYEVSDAIRRGDTDELREELGDLLLQVVFHAQMAREIGAFEFGDVVRAICDKMIERHPHVFAHGSAVSEGELREVWETKKETERQTKRGQDSALDGVALALPALMRSQKLIKRAARKGFKWPSPDDAFQKCREELDELHEAAALAGDKNRLEEETGDLIFACASVAVQYGVDTEKALRLANDKFEARFRSIESSLREDRRDMADVPADQLAELWERSKAGAS
jgi:MazG family protein